MRKYGNRNPRDKNTIEGNYRFVFYTIFPGFIQTYISQPGLFQLMSNTQQSLTHAN